MKKAAIICNGNPPSQKLLFNNIKTTDFVICADGGAGYALKNGIMPNVVLGDFDSIPKKYLSIIKKNNIEIHKFPTDKDATDSDLALNYAIQNGYKDIKLFGITGSRLDHSLTNISLVTMMADKFQSISILDDVQQMYLVTEKIKLIGKKGVIVSLIPLSSEVLIVKTKGLKWELEKNKLKFGESLGVSNQMLGASATIQVSSGKLLVVKTSSKY